MRERLGLAEETHEAGLDEMALNVIASPLQEVRDIFDLMPTATNEDWASSRRPPGQGADGPRPVDRRP